MGWWKVGGGEAGASLRCAQLTNSLTCSHLHSIWVPHATTDFLLNPESGPLTEQMLVTGCPWQSGHSIVWRRMRSHLLYSCSNPLDPTCSHWLLICSKQLDSDGSIGCHCLSLANWQTEYTMVWWSRWVCRAQHTSLLWVSTKSFTQVG